MWQEIIQTAKTALTGDIQQKANVNQEQAQQSVELAGESTREVLTEEAKKGNIQQIIDLFSNRKPSNSSNPLMDKIGSSLIGKLTSQLGLSREVATTVERTVLPFILNVLNKRATGGSGSAPSPQGILALLGGSDALGSGLQDKIKKGLGGLF